MEISKKPERRTKKMMTNEEATERIFNVDFAQTKGDGSFQCPKCGTLVDPDDESEETYKIQDIKMVKGYLAEFTVKCMTCGSTIKVTGFPRLMEDLPIE